MTPKEKQVVVGGLVFIAGTMLLLCWQLREQTMHACSVPGVGEFSFTIERELLDPVCWGGSSIKRIYWSRPDGTEHCYAFGRDSGGYDSTAFVLVNRLTGDRGLLLDNGEPSVYLSFSGAWYGETNDAQCGEAPPLPTDFDRASLRTLSHGERWLIDGLLGLTLTVAWPLLLLANGAALLTICGTLLFMLARRRRERRAS